MSGGRGDPLGYILYALSAPLRTWRAGSLLQEIRCFNSEFAGKPIENIDAGRIFAALNRADVSAVYVGTVRKFLLRQACSLSVLYQIERQNLPYRHGYERGLLKGISPRSILDNLRGRPSNDP
ncbi:hypothetical protein J2R76_003802 [Bradyrhizobium sp. USDA 4532]|nr:hypothetical protein [Bradyrhizobium sp. USDA 4532]